MVRKHLPLILILFLAIVLRFVELGKIPSGISPDEVSQGYSAYSLLKTGRDEWGTSWPITSFRSFLDYKASLQTYLMIPSIAVFGLNEFSVRLPSAIFGVLAVLAIYLLTNELFPKKLFVTKYGPINSGTIAALLLAISPWSIQFSRTALEINLSSFLFPIGLYFFLVGWKNPKYLYLATLAWALNLYSYHASKFFEPLFFVFLAFAYRKQWGKIDTVVKLKIMGITALIAGPLLFATIFGSAGDRAKDLLITNLNSQEIASIAKLQYFSPLNRVSLSIPRAFSNKVVFIINQFVENYVSYLSPSFWFTEGGREITYSVLPGSGLLYLFMFPLILFGLYRMVKDKDPRTKLVFAWLLLAIIPAALTKGGYRPNRVGALLVFWEIVATFGLVKLLGSYRLDKHKISYMLASILSLVLITFYLNTYFFEYQYKYPGAISFGYRDLVSKVNKFHKETKVIIDRGSNSQSFFAFYNKIDPNTFQKYSAIWTQSIQSAKPQYLDQLESYSLENITFKIFNPSADLIGGNLVVIPAEKMSDAYIPYVVDRVLYPDGGVVFYMLQNNEK